MPPLDRIVITREAYHAISDPDLKRRLLLEATRIGSGISIVGTAVGAATGTGGGGGSGGGSAPPPPAPPSGADATTRLLIALAELETAQDGDVLTAHSYNALVAVLRAFVPFAGGGAVASGLAGAGVETLAPALLTAGDAGDSRTGGDAWQVGPEYAEVGDDGFGWMPVMLPDGVLISELTAINERDEAATIEVTLRRLSLVDPQDAGVELCRIRRGKAGGEEVQADSAPVRVRGISTGSALDELRRVDTTQFRYVIEARAVSARVRIYALQVSWER